MMMGGRVVTRSLRYPILRRGIRHVALESQSQSLSSPSPSPSPSPLESRLRTILRNEIQYQYEYAPPHQAFTEFGKFVVEDLPGQQWITLKAKWGEDENITIEATMFDGSIKDKSDDVRHHITMLVDICRARGNGNSMEFICSALSDSIQIHKVYTFNSHNPQPQPQPQPYTGPHIKDLSNGLRSGLYEFLNARGINGDLSSFLHQYMWNKDKIELLHWLGKVQSYIEK